MCRESCWGVGIKPGEILEVGRVAAALQGNSHMQLLIGMGETLRGRFGTLKSLGYLSAAGKCSFFFLFIEGFLAIWKDGARRRGRLCKVLLRKWLDIKKGCREQNCYFMIRNICKNSRH